MKNTLIVGLIALIGWLLFSCTGNGGPGPQRTPPATTAIEALQAIALTPANRDSLVEAWKALLQDKSIDGDNLNAARANYQLARIYGMSHQNDSSAKYLETAFERIEADPGNLDEKARIYQGIGNVSLAEGSLHRANYYYNKAAAILLADSTVALDTGAKTAILLAAAQSNQQFHRYELALEMNHRALVLSHELPQGHINRHRPLTQLIQTMYHVGMAADSIGPYVEQLEALQQQFPGTYDTFFLYESKVLYYDRLGQADSVLKYELRKTQLQEAALATQQHPTAINNLFISYANIAGHYTQSGQLREAQDYFNRAQRLMETQEATIHPDHLIVFHQNLEVFHIRMGQPMQAVAQANEVIRLQEVLHDRQNTQAIAEMNSLYEIQAQERSITQLNESLHLNQLELQRNRLWLLVSVLFAVIAVLVLFFINYSFRQRRIRQEKDRVILQQQLLRTQMEPHFIFNTLTALQHYIRQGRSKEAIQYLSRFSKLLRNSLEISREQQVSLEQEIETLEHYLSLQQMRFDGAFTYRIQTTEDMETDAIRIPPMLVQPVVENAILHGVDMKSGEGFVHVDFFEEHDLLKVVISDSGRTRKQLPPSDGHRSLSGIISRERLALLGKEARTETFRNDVGGTTVHLFIPIA